MRLFVLTGDNPLRDSKWVKRIWLLPKVAITCLYVIKGDKMCLFALTYDYNVPVCPNVCLMRLLALAGDLKIHVSGCYQRCLLRDCLSQKVSKHTCLPWQESAMRLYVPIGDWLYCACMSQQVTNCVYLSWLVSYCSLFWYVTKSNRLSSKVTNA